MLFELQYKKSLLQNHPSSLKRHMFLPSGRRVRSKNQIAKVEHRENVFINNLFPACFFLSRTVRWTHHIDINYGTPAAKRRYKICIWRENFKPNEIRVPPMETLGQLYKLPSPPLPLPSLKRCKFCEWITNWR